MKPSSFENAVRLQFDCLIRKVVDRTVKNYNKELARRAKHEVALCEISLLNLEQLISLDEYQCDFTAFHVYGTEVRIYDEQLCKGIRRLSEKRRSILLMSYFLEMTDVEIASVLEMERFSVCRNRLHTLKLLKDMYEEDENE